MASRRRKRAAPAKPRKPPTATAKRVAYLRTGAKLSARKLSALLGLGDSHVGQFESGALQSLALDPLRRVAELFDVDLMWVAYGAGEKPERATLAAIGEKLASARKAA